MKSEKATLNWYRRVEFCRVATVDIRRGKVEVEARRQDEGDCRSMHG